MNHFPLDLSNFGAISTVIDDDCWTTVDFKDDGEGTKAVEEWTTAARSEAIRMFIVCSGCCWSYLQKRESMLGRCLHVLYHLGEVGGDA